MKDGLGIVVKQTDEVTVEALPADLPESFQVDISKLVEAGQSITVADLVVDKKVTVIDEADKIIAMVEEPQQEEEAAPAPAEGEVVPAEGTAPVEGETPAEGEVQSEEKTSE